MKKSLKIKKKYFLDEEFLETISGSRNVNDKQKLVRKEYTYKSTGSKYIGEWKGGFRHGRGVMQWADGAYYDGEWELGRAQGKGVFTHSKGEVYDGYWF